MAPSRRQFLAHSAGLGASLVLGGPALSQETGSPLWETGAARGEGSAARGVGEMELAIFANAPSTPTGLAISPGGRIFIMMPRFDAKVPYTLGEVARDGSVMPFPDAATNAVDPDAPQRSLMHVPNGVFDTAGHLWVLDAGLPEGKGPPVPGGAKLVQFDIETKRALRTIPLEPGIAPTSSFNDLRVDTQGGRARAFVSDQGQDGEGAILAVDLETERVVRRLAGHASTQSQKGLAKFVEHRPVELDPGEGPARAVQGGANGIALGPDGKRLYYAPLIGRHLYAVDAAALLDPARSNAEIAAMVDDLGEKGMTGGLGADAMDRVYLTLQEQNAVGRRHPDGRIEVIASDPRLVWADTIVITSDKWLYVSAAQVNRRPEYNKGEDRQKPPYAVLRVRIDAGPA
ncbi:SMP-30/gluconolactonase/LRE family protein [Aureimonas sp. AU40]|uniref:SMP-30/gluconolactonase/LRE family protein n=1 Tax=Aureimonas sp. AU40 TaxID=1637747 RepID=UPI000781EACA|nr:L-dopachrome tautomerase-related protein [Aureimonas sp. AU40]